MSHDSSSHDARSPESSPADRAAASRRSFLKLAGVVAAGTAAATMGCAPSDGSPSPASGTAPAGARVTGFDRATLDALGDVVLPASIGAIRRKAAVDAFVAWIDGYDPVAQEMLGYGYSDIRYLPADPAPGWRAQLEGLDLLATRSRGASFAKLDEPARRDVVTAALAGVRGDRLPDPLGAPHVAVALLSHWASGAEAWDVALGAQVGQMTCRRLDGVDRRPLPVVEGNA